MDVHTLEWWLLGIQAPRDQIDLTLGNDFSLEDEEARGHVIILEIKFKVVLIKGSSHAISIGGPHGGC